MKADCGRWKSSIPSRSRGLKEGLTMSEIDIHPVCPKCGEETYPTMILMTQIVVRLAP